jgi:hypothetical protein
MNCHSEDLATNLPFVQSIFAMPIFQFTYDWRDWRWQSYGNPGDQGNAANSTSEPGLDLSDPPVFSGYFYIYLAVTFLFILLTTAFWWGLTLENGQTRKYYWSAASTWKVVVKNARRLR